LGRGIDPPNRAAVALSRAHELVSVMANYTALHYYFVFSTKGRRPWIVHEIEHRVWEYLGGIARTNKMKPLKTGGIDDHIHMLVGAPPTIAPTKIAQIVKGGPIGVDSRHVS
jgi:REP element-mobilizing transposase RayT